MWHCPVTRLFLAKWTLILKYQPTCTMVIPCYSSKYTEYLINTTKPVNMILECGDVVFRRTCAGMDSTDMQQVCAEHQREARHQRPKRGVKRERERVLFYEHVPLQLCVVWPSTHKYYFTFSIFLIRPLICPIYEFTLCLNSAFF